jgi:ABC-type Fe3+-siderophore transport system permease subunit
MSYLDLNNAGVPLTVDLRHELTVMFAFVSATVVLILVYFAAWQSKHLSRLCCVIIDVDMSICCFTK